MADGRATHIPVSFACLHSAGLADDSKFSPRRICHERSNLSAGAAQDLLPRPALTPATFSVLYAGAMRQPGQPQQADKLQMCTFWILSAGPFPRSCLSWSAGASRQG